MTGEKKLIDEYFVDCVKFLEIKPDIDTRIKEKDMLEFRKCLASRVAETLCDKEKKLDRVDLLDAYGYVAQSGWPFNLKDIKEQLK